MRAISLWAPYGSLIARRLLPHKRYETRSWHPPLQQLPMRDLVIHQSARWNGELRDLCFTWPFHQALGSPPWQLGRGSRDIRALLRWSEENCAPDAGRLALGAAVCVVDVTAVRSTQGIRTIADGSSSTSRDYWIEELSFGDYSPGRYAWRMENVRTLREPVPLIGRQGVWTLNEVEAGQVLAAVDVAHA